jgi:hypothetical protein
LGDLQGAAMAKLVIKTEGMPVEVIELKPGLNRLGRSSRNDFEIDHHSISRFHAEIELNEEWMFVRDMDSSNGVFVNGEQVEECPLESGQILRLGDVSMLVKDAPVLKTGRELVACENHPETAATMTCKQCHRKFCGACVHILRRAGGRVLRLCPACSGHCEPLTAMTKDTKGRLTNLVRKLLKKPPPSRPYYD